MKWQNATIRWFDNARGEGMVRIHDTKKCIYFHYSAALFKLKGSKRKQDRPFYFVTFKNYERVRVRVIEDSHFTQVEEIERFEWISLEDFISDMLISFFEESVFVSSELENHILNNILSIEPE